MQKATLLKHWEKEKLITDSEVLQAFRKVKREDFVLKQYRNQAYEDIPLPIGFNATISQPTTVMLMLQALNIKKGNKVLEIGTGSGYNACLISILVGPKGKIFTTEIIPELAEFSKQNLQQYKNILVIQTDGSKGYEKEKPYDRIIYTAAVPKVENHILEQLKDPGIYLAPIGDEYSQELIKVTKKDLKIKEESLGYFQFVPLKGKFGFK